MTTDHGVRARRHNDPDALAQWQRRYFGLHLALELIRRGHNHPHTKAFAAEVLRRDKETGDMLTLEVQDIERLQQMAVSVHRFDGRTVQLRTFDYADHGGYLVAWHAAQNFAKQAGEVLGITVINSEPAKVTP